VCSADKEFTVKIDYCKLTAITYASTLPNLTETTNTSAYNYYYEIFAPEKISYNRDLPGTNTGFTQTPACGWTPTHTATYTKINDTKQSATTPLDKGKKLPALNEPTYKVPPDAG